MPETNHQNKIDKIIEDLNSDDTVTITKALKSLETYGDTSVIRPLAQRLLKDIPEKNKKEILELLSSLKDTSVVSEIVDILGEQEFREIRQLILSTIWNTKVDFSDYIDDFVLYATEGSLLEALDCLTIIENLEGPFMEESLLECQLHLKNYLESGEHNMDQKSYILSEIAIKIKDIEAESESESELLD